MNTSPKINRLQAFKGYTAGNQDEIRCFTKIIIDSIQMYRDEIPVTFLQKQGFSLSESMTLLKKIIGINRDEFYSNGVSLKIENRRSVSLGDLTSNGFFGSNATATKESLVLEFSYGDTKDESMKKVLKIFNEFLKEISDIKTAVEVKTRIRRGRPAPTHWLNQDGSIRSWSEVEMRFFENDHDRVEITLTRTAEKGERPVTKIAKFDEIEFCDARTKMLPVPAKSWGFLRILSIFHNDYSQATFDTLCQSIKDKNGKPLRKKQLIKIKEDCKERLIAAFNIKSEPFKTYEYKNTSYYEPFFKLKNSLLTDKEITIGNDLPYEDGIKNPLTENRDAYDTYDDSAK